MSWSAIEAYIHARATREFMRECRGVPLEHVRECERGLGIELPRMYVEFLLAMGDGSADYHPFGGQYDHDFYLLLEHVGAASYPTEQFFRVGHQVDDGTDVIEEPYLDLNRAADGDTPLVTIEAGGAFCPEHVRDLGRSLAEQLCRSAFRRFGMRHAYGYQVFVVGETSQDALMLMDETLVILQRMGFLGSFREPPFLACLEKPDCAAMVEISGDERTVLVAELVGHDERATLRLAEILVDTLPGATYSMARG